MNWRNRKLLLLYVFMLCVETSLAQLTDWVWPLDSPRVLTANYGELRPNHFHSGLDFSTGGQVNLPVYAAAAGYVSRIKVSATGYGKCVYITHPNGKVTVYAHLNAYSIKINAAARKEQYFWQSYEIDITLPPNLLAVRRGEIIGLSGSTGNSTGPHLHFEVRDEKTEAPLNPLEFYHLQDYTRPQIQSVALFSLADTLSPKFFKQIRVNETDEDILMPETSLITIDQSVLGIGFSGIDRFTPAGSPNNIYSVKLFYDGRLVYYQKLSGIKFDDTRYINEYSETISGLKFQKCFLPQNYPREMVVRTQNRGRIFLPDTNFHMVKLLVTDETGNQNDVQFFVRCTRKTAFTAPALKSDLFVNAFKEFKTERSGVKVVIPAGTLYYSTPLVIENTLGSTGKLIVLPGDANLRNPVSIAFKAPFAGKNKARLVLKNGNAVYTPEVRNDSLLYQVKTLGWFQLVEDNVPPRISPQFNIKGKKTVLGKRLSFVITDALSGILTYKLFVNNKWVLAEFDAKSDLLTCELDEDAPRGKIAIKLEVQDKAGNKTRFELNARR